MVLGSEESGGCVGGTEKDRAKENQGNNQTGTEKPEGRRSQQLAKEAGGGLLLTSLGALVATDIA